MDLGGDSEKGEKGRTKGDPDKNESRLKPLRKNCIAPTNIDRSELLDDVDYRSKVSINVQNERCEKRGLVL